MQAKSRDAHLSWSHIGVTAFAAAKNVFADNTLRSRVAVGAVLQEVGRGVWRPIALLSRKISRAKTNIALNAGKFWRLISQWGT